MNLVLEGPDNSGKSTLARFLAQPLRYTIIGTQGPERYPGEINKRIEDYLQYDYVLFDRHPCVSQRIYGQLSHNTTIRPDLLSRWQETQPLIVYCRGRGLSDHVIKDKAYDTPEHLERITLRHADICRYYDEWALNEAHIIYRVGDSMDRIKELVFDHIRGN